MSNRESFNILNRIIDTLLDAISKLIIKFYHIDIINNRFDLDTKFYNGLEIINSYFDIKDDLMRHKDFNEYYYQNKSVKLSIEDMIEKTIDFQYYIDKYLDKSNECIKVFNIEKYLYDTHIELNNKCIDTADDNPFEEFYELLDDLDNFKIYQLFIHTILTNFISQKYILIMKVLE